jgi:hypothetical protein
VTGETEELDEIIPGRPGLRVAAPAGPALTYSKEREPGVDAVARVAAARRSSNLLIALVAGAPFVGD